MDKRIIAIQITSTDATSSANTAFAIDIAKAFLKSSIDCRLIFFMPFTSEKGLLDNVPEVVFPESADTNPKQKNFIFDYVKSLDASGFLHIVEDSTEILKDPKRYVEQIEHTMAVLDYSIFFSTATDQCNYLFKKFSPRLTIDIDDDYMKEKLGLPNKISFTSHSNTCWTIYDLARLGGTVPRFNEQFTIAMYWIIEYLSRRKATRHSGQLYYMNQYLSIDSEIGTYRVNTACPQQKIDPEAIKSEDAIFKSMGVDYAPDNNIDTVLDAFYEVLLHKMDQHGTVLQV